MGKGELLKYHLRSSWEDSDSWYEKSQSKITEEPPSTTDATDREAAASAPAPHAAESGADGGSGYGGSLA